MTLKFIISLVFYSLLLAGTQTARAETVTLKHNGLTLNANLKLAEGKTLADDLILMTHGTFAHNKMEIIATLQHLFADNGISSLAITLSMNIDNRTGFYDCSIPNTHKHTDAIDEINAWMTWLARQGSEKITLLGHSRGGNQTAWTAVEHDNPMIQKIILIAPQTWNMNNTSNDYQEKYNRKLLPILNKTQALVKNGTPETILDNTDFVYCNDASVSAESFVSYYEDDARKDTPFLLNKLKKPVIVFIGSEDKVVKKLEQAMQPLSEKQNIKIHIIEGADHFFRDIYADELVETAIEFLEE
ncbi:MAG: alpha/beta hydrolase [Gammaproteobacteria bacterium]|nr:alpha/beta hydrolase [Gammaproteobacteria bacterium]